MFGNMIVFAFVIIFAEISSSFGDPKPHISEKPIDIERSSHGLPEIKEGEPCYPGKMYKMDCNRCHCTNNGKLLCTKMACYKVDDFEPKSKPKSKSKSKPKSKSKSKSKSKPKLRAYKKVISASDLPEAPKGPCIPGIVYQNGCNTCICDDKTEIHCGTGECNLKQRVLYPIDLHEPFTNEEIQALEHLDGFSAECTPGKAYTLDCNLCLCNELKSLICDQYACLNFDTYTVNKIAAYEQIGKPCEEDQKYELANTCMNCTCHDGKTECEWKKSCEDKKYTQELKDKVELKKIDPEVDKCIPGGLYTIFCNRCHCTYDAILRCTQMFCLNFAKANELKQEHEYLAKNGLEGS